MRWLTFVLTLLIGACSPGYVAPHATTRLELSSPEQMDRAARAIEAKFTELGFEIHRGEATPPRSLKPAGRLVSFSREGDGFPPDVIRARLTLYDAHAGEYIPYGGDANMPPTYPFLEVHISNMRPDGFGRPALAVHSELDRLFQRLGGRVSQLSLPPAGDDNAYAAYVIDGYVKTAIWWIAIWAVGMTLIAWPIAALLHRVKIDRSTRRVLLVAAGTLLVTPTPFPTMFVMLLLPNVVALLDPAYLLLPGRYDTATLVMFAVSFGLNVLVAFALVRKRPLADGGRSSETTS